MILTGANELIKAEGYFMVITSHFHRNHAAKDFALYASNWLAANRESMNEAVFKLLHGRFPKCEKRMIATGYSDWNSYGNRSYK